MNDPVMVAPVQSRRRMRVRELRERNDFTDAWDRCDILVPHGQAGRKLYTAFACSDRAVDAALRLRYEVFAIELGHQAGTERGAGIDCDEYDPQMTHLLLLDSRDDSVVGTYRIQTATTARARNGLYSAREYQLDALENLLDDAVECGRACIAADYRKANSLLALWYGIRTYMKITDTRWLFGCSSVSTEDPNDGWRVMKTLRAKGCLHSEIMLSPTPEFSCGPASREFDADVKEPLELPRLFAAYMRLGARVISLPALDREFGTVDFLVMADVHSVNMARLGLK